VRIRRQPELIPASRIVALAALGVAVSLAIAPTRAAAQAKFVDEVKIGVLAHDIGFLTHHVEGGADLNLELLFPSPDLLAIIGSPRPHIGADINTAGNTSDGYFGLTWGWTLLPSLFGGGAVFTNGSLGGAVQDGFTGTKTSVAPPGRKLLGSQVLFRESAELGYQITPIVSISAILDHISNANLAPRNAGITSAGARLGFKF
jgi:lipid A 3-O-deacylase